MARPLRIDPEFGIHHVFTRGTKRWVIFHDDIDRRRFMGILSMVCERYDVSVLAYCLMDNHFHLVVQCPEAGLSDSMRDLKSIYARRFNQRHQSSGPIFEDRFGSKLVTSHRQIRQLVRYVHRNPLGIDPKMDLGSFPWSSHAVYLGHRGRPTWLDLDVARPLFGSYQSDVENPILSDAVQNHRRPSVAVSGTATLQPERPALAEIHIALAHAAGCNVGDIGPQRRNGLVGLALVIALDEGYSFTEIFEPFGYRTARAAQRAAQRARQRLTEHGPLNATLAAALARLHRAAA